MLKVAVYRGMMSFVNAKISIGAVLLVGALLLLFSVGTTINYVPFFPNQALVLRGSDADVLSARTALVVNTKTDDVLLEKNIDEVRPIASVTKLFTAHVAVRSEQTDVPALVVWQDFVTEGDAGGLRLGETYSVRELLFPLLLTSSNDAAAAIVRTLGQASVKDTIETLYVDADLENTHIADASGLSDRNQSTARDLAKYLEYLNSDERYVLDITSLDRHLGTYRGLINNNPARSFDTFVGGKNGYTPAAGRTFAGMFRTETGTYTVVLLGSKDLLGDIAFIVERLP